MSDSAQPHPASGELKYPPGVSARPGPATRPLLPLEWLVLIHVGIFFVGTTWAFGGGADFVRPYLRWWGTLGLLLTFAAVCDSAAWREGAMRPLVWLWPLVAFNALVLVACLNPNLRELRFGADVVLAPGGARPGWPSSARPLLALKQLWLIDVVWLSCFNLVLLVRQRRALRGLLLLAVLNTLVLAVFGTVQKLSHAKGLFFDAVPSPQKFFFSSFVYHNHWGAFAVLMAAACLGLVWHYARRRESRDAYHSPALVGLVIVLAIAVTAPLSTSRSCTALMALLLVAALAHWMVRLVQKRRRFQESAVLPIAGALAAVALAVAGIWYVAKESIDQRVAKTREQLADMRARGSIGARVVLYRNTWRMAQDQPVFGWGMASYPHVFMRYNTLDSPQDGLPVFYNDAHSDWLQSFAEHGYVGTALLGALGLVPLLGLRRRHFVSALPGYLFAGCGLILLYAWVEFPFGNVAVVLTWWLCYFCALHYARLQERDALAALAAGSRAPAPALCFLSSF
ncbi:MAG: hypothetical protein RLZZ15_2531 [Verrucomicrobiota bacterium]|jgi:O-antigen ligase